MCAGGQHQGDQPCAHLPQDPREARPERQGGRLKLVETAILHHHHAPAELAKAKEDKRLIAEAYTRVSTHEAEEKAEKAKAAAMKKLRKIEEEEDDVEPSDVARGKGKMRRIK